MPSRTASTRSSDGLGWTVSLAALPVTLMLVTAVALLLFGGMGRQDAAGRDGSAAPPKEAPALEATSLQTVLGDERLQGELSVRREEGDVAEVARTSLRAYQDQGLVLVEAGWLDLAGRTWGCVVWSGEWSEVCLVRGDASGEWSEVRVMRIAGSGWEEAHGSQGGA